MGKGRPSRTHPQPVRRRRAAVRASARRSTAVLAVLATAVGIVVALPQSALAAPPPPVPKPSPVAKPGPATVQDPSDSQLNAASAAKQSAANQIGSLSAQIASTQAELQQLRAKQELAEQKVALAVQQYESASNAYTEAVREVTAAKQAVATAHARFVQYLQATYMYGDSSQDTTGLLAANDPSTLLSQASLQQYEAQHKVGAVGTYERATVARSNAQARSKLLLTKRQKAKQHAETVKKQVDAQVAADQQQEADLQSSLTQTQAQYQSAQLNLATLQGQRAQYLAHQAAEARYSAFVAAQGRYQSYQDKLAAYRLQQAAQRAAAARAAAARAAANKAKHSQHHGGGGGSSGGNGGSSGGGGGSGYVAPSAPRHSGSSASRGVAAANRALSQVGVPYVWAAGNAYGPTTGGCTDDIVPCGVRGYDCSGLAIFAWGATNWVHYTVWMYSNVGHHVSLGNLRKGDLIFYQPGEIHHVAIYIGNGRIVQAPFSGATVTTSSMYEPGPILGAVRP